MGVCLTVKQRRLRDAPAMKLPEQPGVLPLDYVAELAVEIHLMRGECCRAANQIVSKEPPDFAALEECARLDEVLSRTQRLLQATLIGIQHRRPRKGAAPG